MAKIKYSDQWQQKKSWALHLSQIKTKKYFLGIWISNNFKAENLPNWRFQLWQKKANQFSAPTAIFNNDILEMNTQWKCKQCLLRFLQFNKKRYSGVLLGWGPFWNKILRQIPTANHVKKKILLESKKTHM